MAQYIDKDALVAEIYRLRDFANDRWNIEEMNGVDKFLDKLIPYINSLEVKEVELDEHQIADIIQNLFPTDQFIESETLLLDKEEAIIFAKHFFELGLKAQK